LMSMTKRLINCSNPIWMTSGTCDFLLNGKLRSAGMRNSRIVSGMPAWDSTSRGKGCGA
jgi:hypothetical protein